MINKKHVKVICKIIKRSLIMIENLPTNLVELIKCGEGTTIE